MDEIEGIGSFSHCREQPGAKYLFYNGFFPH